MIGTMDLIRCESAFLSTHSKHEGECLLVSDGLSSINIEHTRWSAYRIFSTYRRVDVQVRWSGTKVPGSGSKVPEHGFPEPACYIVRRRRTPEHPDSKVCRTPIPIEFYTWRTTFRPTMWWWFNNLHHMKSYRENLLPVQQQGSLPMLSCEYTNSLWF